MERWNKGMVDQWKNVCSKEKRMIKRNATFFFPPNCSAQSWIANFITSQINSPKMNALHHVLLGYDFSSSSLPSFLSFSPSEHFGTPDALKEIHDRRNDMLEKIICLNTDKIASDKTFYADRDLIKNGSITKTKVNSEKNLSLLNQTLPAHWSRFVPKIDLKLQIKNGKNIKRLDFPFNKFTDVSKILDNEFSRGDGAGIHSLKVERKITVPKNNGYVPTTISMEFKFQSLAVLNQKVEPGFASFTKLISFLQNVKGERLILEYGWAVPESYEHHDPILQSLVRYIDGYETKRLSLLYSGHTLNFEENGEITLSVTYNALQDLAPFKQKSFMEGVDRHVIKTLNIRQDIIVLHEEMTEKMKEAESIEGQIANLALIEDADSDDIKKKKQELQAQKTTLFQRINLLRKILLPYSKDLILQSMKNNFSLFHINFDSNKVGTTIESKAYINIISSKKGKDGIIPIAELISSKNLALATIPTTAKASDATALNLELEKFYGFETSKKKFGDMIFFPLKALVQTAYQLLPLEEKEDFSETLFCNVSYSASAFAKPVRINIGDIFIELQEFQKWYFNKFIKNDVLEFSFGDLLRSCCELATIGLNTSFGKKRTGISGGLVHLSHNWISKKATLAEKKKIYYDGNISELKSFVENYIGDSSADPVPLNILSMHPSSFSSKLSSNSLLSSFAGVTSFDEKRDAANGIYSIQIGAATGILKKISFSADDFQFWRTALWLQSQKDWNVNQPRYRYSFDGTFIGTSAFWNGSIVAIPEKPFGVSTKPGGPFVQDLGIAGYYLVFDNTDSIQNGIYETSIKGMWQWNPKISTIKSSSLSKDSDDPEPIAASGEEGTSDAIFAELYLSPDLTIKKSESQAPIQPVVASNELLTGDQKPDKIILVNHASSKETRGRLSLT